MRPQTIVCVLVSVLVVATCAASAAPGNKNKATGCDDSDLEETLLFPFRCADKDAQERREARLLGEALRQKAMAGSNAPNAGDIEYPVILMPGLGASAIEAKLWDNDPRPHPAFCKRVTNSYFRLWLGLQELIPYEIDCWYHNLDIEYNATTNTYSEPHGIDARPMDFGGLHGVDYLDVKFGKGVGITSVYGPMIEALKARGFVEGKTLFGAPFDWRLPPEATLSYPFYANLTRLFESAYETAGNKSVYIVCHSMGNIHMGTFLSLQTQEWKDKYVRGFVSLAGPWSGAPKTIRGVVSGDNNGIQLGDISLVDPLRLRTIIRKAGGITWLFPQENMWEERPVVRVANKTYTAHDLEQLLLDIDANDTAAIYRHTKPLTQHIKAPNVTTYCIYGTGVPTEFSYNYPDGNVNVDPQITYDDDGDGTVPAMSLRKCFEFQTEQEAPVYVQEFPLEGHFGMLKSETIIKEVVQLVAED